MKKLNNGKFFLLSLFIMIHWGWACCGYSLSASFPKKDAGITAELQALIKADLKLPETEVHINTAQAVVSIEGEVDTLDQAKRLVLLANSVAGVHAVNVANLLIKDGKKRLAVPVDDIINGAVLGLYVREGLLDMKHLDAGPIHVRTQGGVVYLTGIVETEAKAQDVVSLAQSVSQVVAVKSSLTTLK